MVHRILPPAPAAIEGAVSSVLEEHAATGETLESIVHDMGLTRCVIGEVATRASASPDSKTYRLSYYALGLRAQQNKVL